MSWLFITIFAYFLFAVTSLIDKYLLKGLLPNPKIYSFYTGIFGILILILAPFGFLKVPSLSLIVFALLAGVFRILALFCFFTALQKFEASRVVPAIGGILPLFIFCITYFLKGGKEILEVRNFIAFIFLILGSVLISWEKEKKVSFGSLKISILSAFLFALSFVISKYVYSAQTFLSGFIWITIGAFLVAIFFIFSKEVREEVFRKKKILEKKTAFLFFSNQAMGAGAFILRDWAIALAPLSFLAIINALQGTQYVFLLIFSIFLSLKFPQILKEEISKEVLIQKIVAIFLIGIGLAILAFK
jgi:drug/metabolite transporter (DMT)-like permease